MTFGELELWEAYSVIFTALFTGFLAALAVRSFDSSWNIGQRIIYFVGLGGMIALPVYTGISLIIA